MARTAVRASLLLADTTLCGRGTSAARTVPALAIERGRDTSFPARLRLESSVPVVLRIETTDRGRGKSRGLTVFEDEAVELGDVEGAFDFEAEIRDVPFDRGSGKFAALGGAVGAATECFE